MPDIKFDIKGLERVTGGITQLRQSLTGTREEAQKLGAVDIAPSGGSADAGQAIGQFSQQTEQLSGKLAQAGSAVGQLDAGLGIAVTGIADFAEVAQGLSTTLASGSKGAILASGALAGLTVGAIALSKVSEQLRRNQEEYLKELERAVAQERILRDLSLGLADESLEARRSNIDFERQLIQDQIAELQAEAARANEEIRGVIGGDEIFRDLVKGAGDLVGIDTDTLDAKIKELEDTLKDLDTELSTLNTEEAYRVTQIQSQMDLMNQERDLRQQLYNITEDQLDQMLREREFLREGLGQDIGEILTDLLSKNASSFGFNKAVNDIFATFQEQGEITAESLEALRNLTPDSQALVANLVPLVNEFNSLNNEIEFLSTTGRNQVETLSAQREELDKVNQSQVDYTDTLKSTTDELAKLSQEANDIRAALSDERAKQTTDDLRTYIEEAYQARIEEAKATEQQIAIEGKITDIRSNSAKKSIELTRSLQSELATLERDYFANRRALEQDYMQASAEAFNEFTINQRRQEEDYSRERLRAIEDLNDNLAGAALDNDIQRFIAIQKEGEKTLKREAENFDTSRRRQFEDFARETEAKRSAFAQQLVDLQTQFETERAQRIAEGELKLKELQTQAEREIAVARQAGVTKITESQRLEQQLQALRNQWRVADENTARQIRLQGFQNELKDIQTQEAYISQIRLAATQAFVSAIAGQLSGGLGLGGGGSIPTIEGATVKGSAINVNVGGVNMGAIATPSDLDSGLKGIADAVMQGISLAYKQVGGA